MDAKTYLRQLARMDKRIDALVERQERYRELAARRTTVYRDMPGGGRRCASSCEEYVCKIVDLGREIDRQIDEYVDLTREIEALIECLRDSRHRDLLTWRYINCWDWDKIADALRHTSVKAVWNLHSVALFEFTNVLQHYGTSAKFGG
ncbi:MAG: hypothetical protein VB065_14005 [Eubacteriales bacterium]|nr:hypothetical protein [Christensenellaceae bacterium]MEA5067149.1 hypothetical protein [Eubacteriales bacterium]